MVVGAMLAVATWVGCVAIDEVQTPNGDIDLEREAAGGGGEGSAGAGGATGRGQPACGAQGWAFVQLGGRDQLPSWSSPVFTLGCGAEPHRLTALAPRLGSALSLDVSASTGRALEATYSTTGTGADGEQWGDYEALIDLETLTFGATSADQQPFQLEGTILGPFGPVPIALSGCALLRSPRC